MSKAIGPLLRHGARRGLPTKAGFSRGNGNGSIPLQGYSRRDMLRLGAHGVAAALLAPALGNLAGCANRGGGNAAGNGRSHRRGRAPTVIVVGAGFAGLACADTLAYGGANVVVLEATARPGGRVRTDRAFISGDSVELGGEWIGRNHPTWLAYAQEFSLRLEEPNAAPEAVPPREPAGENEPPPTLPPRPGETPEKVQPAPDGDKPQPAPGAAGAAPADRGTDAPPAFVAPRPKPFETEMELPGGESGPSGRASERSDLRLAMFAQPADAQPDTNAPAQDQPEKRPDAPPGRPSPGAADTKPPAEPSTQPGAATQPATTSTTSTTSASGEAEEPIIVNGKLIRGEAADKLYKEVDEVYHGLIELARNVDPVRPWTASNAAELDGKSFADYVKEQKDLSDTARAVLLSTAESDNGVVPERMSLLAYLAMVAGGGFQSYYDDTEVYRLADGNDALATALAQKLGDRLHLNSAVDLIRRDADGVTVRTRGGDVYQGDAVVLAVPPSVWKRVQLLPPLSESIQPQMGENVKLIVALREAVWEKQNLTSELQSDGLVGMTWAATNPLSRGPVALTLFSGGHQAEDLRRLDPTLRNERAFRSIAPAYPDLPAAVIKARFVDWPGMPMTQASYSFPAPGQVTAFGPLLVDGVAGDGRAPLMFAGEHTAYAFIGYMEGALSSGVRAARTLLGEEMPLGPATAPATTTPASEIAPDPLAPDAPQSEPESPETIPAPAEKEGAPA